MTLTHILDVRLPYSVPRVTQEDLIEKKKKKILHICAQTCSIPATLNLIGEVRIVIHCGYRTFYKSQVGLLSKFKQANKAMIK